MGHTPLDHLPPASAGGVKLSGIVGPVLLLLALHLALMRGLMDCHPTAHM